MKVHRRTNFFGRECSDYGVGGWVSCNPNVVRICKSVRNIGRSLSNLGKKYNQFLEIFHDSNWIFKKVLRLMQKNCKTLCKTFQEYIMKKLSVFIYFLL